LEKLNGRNKLEDLRVNGRNVLQRDGFHERPGSYMSSYRPVKEACTASPGELQQNSHPVFLFLIINSDQLLRHGGFFPSRLSDLQRLRFTESKIKQFS